MKNKNVFFLSLIPLFNTVVILTTHFFDGPFHLGYIRIFIFLLLTVLAYSKLQKNVSSYYIAGMTIYLLPIALISTNISESIDIYLKFVTSLNMFIVGYVLLNKKEYLAPILKITLFCFFLIIVYLGLAQIIGGLGETVYETDIYIPGGGRGVYTMNQIVYTSLLLPLFFYGTNIKKSQKKFYLLLTIASAVFLLIVFRRSALLAYIIGFFVWFIYNLKYKKPIKLFFTVILILLIASPYLYEQYQVRQEMRGGIEEIADENFGRVKDVQLAVDAFNERNFSSLFIGDDKLFTHKRVAGTNRRVHNDFAALFLGSGLIGFIFFCMIHIRIYKDNHKTYKRSIYGKKTIIIGTIAALLSATFILSMANQYWTMSSLSTAFFYLGIVTKYNLLTSLDST